MTPPWKCPDCKTWLAAWVQSHRCEDPPAAPQATTILPYGPVTGGSTFIDFSANCKDCGASLAGGHSCGVVLPSQSISLHVS